MLAWNYPASVTFTSRPRTVRDAWSVARRLNCFGREEEDPRALNFQWQQVGRSLVVGWLVGACIENLRYDGADSDLDDNDRVIGAPVVLVVWSGSEDAVSPTDLLGHPDVTSKYIFKRRLLTP
jgi:hypothetical protein